MAEDRVIIFIPYGSRLGFHDGGVASTMANIDYKFPQCVCYEEVPMDVKCFRKSRKTGHGYGDRWVEDKVTNTLNTFEFNSDTRTPEIVVYDARGNGDGGVPNDNR